MVLWTDSTKTTVCETAPSTLPAPPILTHLERQVIVSLVLAILNGWPAATPRG